MTQGLFDDAPLINLERDKAWEAFIKRKDAERLPRLTKSEYNKRGKDKMRRRPASIFHVAGLANATNKSKKSFNQKFQGSHEVHEVRAREVDRARNQR